ncbi:hypothetical protein AVEN_211450-1 [Araneus ventricosus]|uniref:Uncharacterized protein n=1 Tax=Araneus ventricosus TaxID=182803 RepID=A0A4Y2J0C7_ARAVE|nr:hypothetical protein AVEN_211450-1 [Araneus ventricosus]
MASVRMDILSHSFVDIWEMDKQAKNPWRWEWLEKQAEGSSDKKENGETPYGLPPAYAAFGPVAQENLLQPLTSLSDRTGNLEAMLLGFLAEKSLTFAVAPNLLELVKEMSKDRKALNRITMHRNAASYKTRFGLPKTVKEAFFAERVLFIELTKKYKQ